MLRPVGNLGEGRASRCGPSACMVLTSDILHPTVAWISAALSSSADNPLAHIWWWLLGSRSSDKIPLMIVAFYLPAQSKEGQGGGLTALMNDQPGIIFRCLWAAKKVTCKKKRQKQVAVTVTGIPWQNMVCFTASKRPQSDLWPNNSEKVDLKHSASSISLMRSASGRLMESVWCMFSVGASRVPTCSGCY